MKESKTIIRVSHNNENPYVMINKEFLNNQKLSWKAKGILTYLLSKPDDWKTIITHLVKQSTDGEKSVYAGLAELKKYKYLISKRIYKNGKISHWESFVFEKPFINETLIDPLLAENREVDETLINPLLAENLQVENLQVENLQVENAGLLINDYTNNDITKKRSSSKKKTKLNDDDSKFLFEYQKKFEKKYNAIFQIDELTKLYLLKNKNREVLNTYFENYDIYLNAANEDILDVCRFFNYLVKKEIPLPVKHNTSFKNNKPIQSTNYEQREYTDDYFNSLYDNVQFIK